MTEDDIRCSKDEIEARFPTGSPDYPSHHKGCGCSGCYASWSEWRSAHMGFSLGVMAASALVLERSRDAADAVALSNCILGLVSG